MGRRPHNLDRDREREHQRLVARARRGEREVSSFASAAARPALATDSISMRARRAMLEAEDRRQFYPEPQLRPAKLLDGRPTRGVRVASAVKKKQRIVRKVRVYREDVLPWQVAFKDPKRLLVCIRRRIRREVIHALRLKGKGRGGSRRLTEYSGIRC